MAQRWDQGIRWLRPLSIVMIMFLVSRVMLVLGGSIAVAVFKPSQFDTSQISSVLLAGLLISNAALLGAALLLHALTVFETGDRFTARRAVLYFLLASGTLSLTPASTESLVLLGSLGAFYAVRRRWWAGAILAGMLATLTHIIGIVLWGVVLWEMFQAWREDQRAWDLVPNGEIDPEHESKSRRVTRFYLFVAACTLLIPLTLAGLMLSNTRTVGDPLTFSMTQAVLGQSGVFTPRIIMLVAGVLLIIPIWRRWGTSYGVYTLIVCLISMVSRLIDTPLIIPFTMVGFPVFMLLAVWGKRPWVDKAITITLAILLGVLMSEFIPTIFIGS